MPPEPSPSAVQKQTKRGTPKAKGAVRAKSGCYTCRIRRKKCDEKPDDQGRCETCVRLRLQCLGFGAKRPDWLRESSNVSDLRDKIKSFLASQGMIKGHSGSGSRISGQPQQDQQPQEPATLKLASENYPNSETDSPPGHLLVLNDDVRHTQQVSNVRGESQWVPTGSFPPPPQPGPAFETHPILHHTPAPPPGSNRPATPPFPQAPAYDPYLMQQSAPATANSTTLAPAAWPQNPVYTSSFGALYNWAPPPSDVDMDIYPFSAAPAESASTSTALIPARRVSDLPPITLLTNPNIANETLLQHYICSVLSKQYLLADDPISRIMMEAVQSGAARDSALLLAAVHHQHTIQSTIPSRRVLSGPDTAERLRRLEDILKKDNVTDNDAISALTVISTFLFDGGYGEWQQWLQFSVDHSKTILRNHRSRYFSFKDSLLRCNSTERFIIKTTIWFDVLASVTTMDKPLFQEVINDLFNPTDTSRVQEIHSIEESEALSMMNIMGTEGRVIWAFAQTSVLAQQRDNLKNRGMLDLGNLVRKGNEIEQYLQTPPSDTDLALPSNVHRLLVSEVFRNAARLYLLTVIHGDFPNVPSIRQAVEQTMQALLKSVEYSDEVRQTVVRSTVVAVYMVGCLAKNQGDMASLMDKLTAHGGWGNAKAVKAVIDEVWHLRNTGPASNPVPWRQRLKHNKLLLV